MSYNIKVACHTHREMSGALRGEEARIIRQFSERHPGNCQRAILVDNGWSSPDEFPSDYKDIYEEISPPHESYYYSTGAE